MMIVPVSSGVVSLSTIEIGSCMVRWLDRPALEGVCWTH